MFLDNDVTSRPALLNLEIGELFVVANKMRTLTGFKQGIMGNTPSGQGRAAAGCTETPTESPRMTQSRVA